MNLLFKIIILVWLNSYPIVEAANFKIMAKSVKCFNVDPNYFNVTRCYIRAERGRRGLLNVVIEITKPLDTLLDHVQIFTKTSAGTFQPWVVNVDINGCDAPKAFSNPLIVTFMKFFETFVPNLKKGCPFSGVINMTDWEFDREATRLLPPIIPEGTFLYHHRVYTSSNYTFFEAKFVCEVRPIGTADLIKLG